MKKTPARYLLRERKTRFVELFRTTPARTVCPNFYVLAHANGCAFSPRCAYCYLKSSLWHLGGKSVAFTNTSRLLAEVRHWIGRNDLESYTLNAGNLSDSLGFEDRRSMLLKLVELFRKCAPGKPHTLLLVTKGGRRASRPLLSVAPCENVVVSFSLNDPQAARRYERGAASVSDRLAAARILKNRGWRIRIRIDPMMRGYQYETVTRKVADLRPELVTLGCLRAEPGLAKFVRNGLFKDLVPPSSPNGLARYPRAVRLSLYRSAVEQIRRVCAVGLCEETPDVWDELGLDRSVPACNCAWSSSAQTQA